MNSKTDPYLLFWEKPGCVGNNRQKLLLRQWGQPLQVRNLLVSDWTADELATFFDHIPVPDWFNLSAPKVRQGLIAIHQLTSQQALDLMVAEPILIKRPLLQYGVIKQAGFIQGPVFDALGIMLDDAEDYQSCARETLNDRVKCEVSV